MKLRAEFDYDELLTDAAGFLDEYAPAEPVPDEELQTRAARFLAGLPGLDPTPVVAEPTPVDYAGLLDEAAEFLTGLPQLREQSRDHLGRFGSGGGGAAAMHDEATIRGTFSYHDPKTGLEAEVVGIVRDRHSTEVHIAIRDRTGKQVGEAMRTIGPAGRNDTVRHDGMGLFEPGLQGQGFGTRFNAHAEESYRAHGIEKITVHANIDVGGYSHARAGYNFKDDNARASAVVHMAQTSRQYPPAIREQVNAAIRNHNVTPIELAMIGHTPGATTWPGKEMLLGSDWEGVKTL